eukprot:2728350-Prymnesium_polylepis.1
MQQFVALSGSQLIWPNRLLYPAILFAMLGGLVIVSGALGWQLTLLSLGLIVPVQSFGAWNASKLVRNLDLSSAPAATGQKPRICLL